MIVSENGRQNFSIHKPAAAHTISEYFFATHTHTHPKIKRILQKGFSGLELMELEKRY
jgi:hypothetical protein